MTRAKRRGMTLAVVVLAAVLFSATGAAQAQRRDGAPGSRRTGWATLLVTYAGLSALATGGAYLLRDNFAGRSIAVTAGAFGGASLGAGAAYGLALIPGCHAADCEEERAMPAFLGAFLGGVVGSLVSTWETRQPGMSRPTVAALGMAPFFVFASLGTIFDW